RAMIYLQNVAPKDGTTIGLVHSSVPFAPLYGIKGANFDPRRMNWIGSINSATGICVSWTGSGITKWADLFDKEYVVGGTGAGSGPAEPAAARCAARQGRGAAPGFPRGQERPRPHRRRQADEHRSRRGVGREDRRDPAARLFDAARGHQGRQGGDEPDRRGR